MPTLPPSPRYASQGAAALTLLLLMLGLIGILGLVEIGYLYWAKRDLQKVVDLAALAGAQRLDTCTPGLDDNAAARSNALGDNGFTGGIVIRCGYWDSASGNVVVAPGQGRALDAVQVDGSRPAVPFFGQVPDMPRLRARAIARSGAPLAAFSVGSRLVNVNDNAAVQKLLRLVGVDLSDTQVASFSGLANVRLTPAGLLEALGIPVSANLDAGDFNALLAAHQVSIGDLVGAVAAVGSRQGVANVDVSALRTRLASLGLDSLLVRLGSAGGNPGLFAGIAAGKVSAASALDVGVDALSLVTTALQIANAGHAVALDLGVSNALNVKASVIEPPSIAIGPVGTTAYNSQVRLFVDLDTDNIAVLGSLLRILGVRVKLPLFVDVVDGYGVLERVDCRSQPAVADIGVTSTIANICAGRPHADRPWNSTRELCAEGLGNENVLTLLGRTVLDTRIQLGALSDHQTLTLGIGESGVVQPNTLALGTLVDNLVDTLFGLLGDLFSAAPGSAGNNAKELARNYLEATKDPVTGLYNTDRVIDALKNGTGNLPALGTWQTDIVVCTSWVLFSSCRKERGDVWVGYKNATTISDASLLGGLLDVLGVTACDGLLSGLLAYNTCLRDNLATSLQTKPGGLQDMGYDPVTGTGSCSSVLCLLLKPLVHNVLRPILDQVGLVLSRLIGDVVGLQLGRSVVTVHDIQCGSAELVY